MQDEREKKEVEWTEDEGLEGEKKGEGQRGERGRRKKGG